MVKFIDWNKAEVETSKEAQNLPVGTSGFKESGSVS
jgi:hypothetical protein